MATKNEVSSASSPSGIVAEWPDDPRYSDASMSKTIRMTHGAFLSEMIFRYAWIWILALSLTAVAGIFLGIAVDLRWLVVALLLICVVAPGILAFLYYFHGLKRGFFVNTIPHRIVITENGLILRLQIPLESRSGQQEADQIETAGFRYRDEFFAFESLSRFVIGRGCAIVPLRKPESGFIWIPEEAFNNQEHLAVLLRLLDLRYDNTINKINAQ